MIASSLCVGTINAYHSGIGGVSTSYQVCYADQKGGYMLVRFNNDDGTHGYEMIDFRETMPSAGNETVCPIVRSKPMADDQMYSQYGPNQTQSTVGGLAVGVPGEMRGKPAPVCSHQANMARMESPPRTTRSLTLVHSICSINRPSSKWFPSKPRFGRRHPRQTLHH